MSEKQNLLVIYTERLEKLKLDLQYKEALNFKFSLARLLLFFTSIFAILYLFSFGALVIIIALIITGFLFALLVKRHIILEKEIIKNKASIEINQNEIDNLSEWVNLYYNGSHYETPYHNFSEDLDVLGPNSLFARVNRSKTFHGNYFLSKYFLDTSALQDIHERQSAVQEMRHMLDWRQELQARLFSGENLQYKDISQSLERNLNFKAGFISAPLIKYSVLLTPFIWALLLIFSFVNQPVAEVASYGFILLLLIFYFRYAKEIGKIQVALSDSHEIIENYAEALQLIINHRWKASFYNKILSGYSITKEGNTNTISSYKTLKSLIDKLDYRLNFIVGMILNLFCLWDFRILSKIKDWKTENEGKIIELFAIIGKYESIMSLATWAYNNPEYNFASIHDDDFSLSARNISHPLIKENQSVSNDFDINNTQKISIITGSNMSGKSTLLRTLGSNMVLSYAGTVCAAEKLEFSIVQIMTYMRIKDALEENVSTFKAELNRVEKMIHLISNNKKSLVLIDEMLRGTNSLDKLKGSIAITKKILRSGAYAMIATHDIKLTELGKENPENVKNFYFDIEFSEGELQFDYKVKPGVCENFNASFLLQKIGIE